MNAPDASNVSLLSWESVRFAGKIPPNLLISTGNGGPYVGDAL